eukprot:GEMP01045362.1.p1 GENE.GEMP01045362.1~~GEMP01045362.1.p1  ORF type:complete len:188 (+),score=26.85 GEMP01045362.1:90-653(+)
MEFLLQEAQRSPGAQWSKLRRELNPLKNDEQALVDYRHLAPVLWPILLRVPEEKPAFAQQVITFVHAFCRDEGWLRSMPRDMRPLLLHRTSLRDKHIVVELIAILIKCGLSVDEIFSEVPSPEICRGILADNDASKAVKTSTLAPDFTQAAVNESHREKRFVIKTSMSKGPVDLKAAPDGIKFGTGV